MVNLGETEAVLDFTAYDEGGRPLAGRDLVNPRSVLLSPGSQIALLDGQIFGSGLTDVSSGAWLKIASSENRIAGFFLVFDRMLSILDGDNVTSKTGTSLILPEVDALGSTRLQVINPGEVAARVMVELVGSDGGIRSGPKERTVNGNGTFSEFLSDLFPNDIPAASDYIRITADRPVAAFERFGRDRQYMASLSGFDVTEGATLLFCPQYVTGSGWHSSISILNLDSNSGTVSFQLFDDDGNPLGVTKNIAIQGGGKIVVSDPNFFLASTEMLTQGHVRVWSSGIRLAGSVVFGDMNTERFATALPLVSELTESAIFGHVVSDETYFMGLAVANPTGSPLSAVVELFDSSGRSVQKTTETVPARGRRSRLLTQYFPELAGEKIGSGFIKVTAGEKFAGFALFGTHSLSALSAIPAHKVPEP